MTHFPSMKADVQILHPIEEKPCRQWAARLTRAVPALALRAPSPRRSGVQNRSRRFCRTRGLAERARLTGPSRPSRCARRRQGAPASEIAPGHFVELAFWRRGRDRLGPSRPSRCARRRQGAPASKIAPGDFVELAFGGEGEIRTREGREALPVFKTVHSTALPPLRCLLNQLVAISRAGLLSSFFGVPCFHFASAAPSIAPMRLAERYRCRCPRNHVDQLTVSNRELAVALIAAYQGIVVLAAALRDPGLIGVETGRLARWIDSLTPVRPGGRTARSL